MCDPQSKRDVYKRQILDCKSPECKKIAENAPVVTDYLCDECETHFTAVKRGLAKLGIAYTVDPKIVRGLDYYTKTVFEFVSNDIGAQGTVIGGGRYDGLVEELGGKPTPALGFGMGIERFLLLLSAQGIELPKPASCDLYIGSIGAPAGEKAMVLADRLRTEGFSVQFDVMERSVKAQMKYANKLGAKMSMILGDNELVTGKANVKDMATGEQKEIAFETELVNVLYDAALASEADALAGELGEDAFRRIMQMGKTE